MTRGFSLIELVMVLTIMGITAAIAVPKYTASVSRYRVESASARILQDIELMRTRARAASAPRVMTFSVASDRYRVTGERGLDRGTDYIVELSKSPYAADITLVDFNSGSSLTIDGFGSVAETGRIVIRSGTEYRTVFVGTSSETVEVGDKVASDEPIDLGGGVTDLLK